MRRTFIALSTIGLVVGLGAPADAGGGVKVFDAGISSGYHGFTVQTWASDDLTNPNNHQVTDYCNFSINGVGNDVVITIVATATATAHIAPVSTGIACRVLDEQGNQVHSAALALPGATVTVVSPSGVLRNNGPYTVCSTGSGQWSDTHLFATPERCQDPNLPIVRS